MTLLRRSHQRRDFPFDHSLLTFDLHMIVVADITHTGSSGIRKEAR